ncbi:MAG TPA: hypothetical protein VFX59_17485 [Polyangiales bacterium]|nr:hypothetical protein [Polyangiales bacterium]
MRGPAAPVARTELAEFLRSGVSLAAVTRDDRMIVEITRCGGARQGSDGRIWVAVPLPEGKRTLTNVEATRVIALSAAYPLDYRTVQLKGSDAQRVEWPELAQVTLEHRQRMADVLASLGTPHAPEHLWSRDFAAVVFTPDEMYDQTPGPQAGLALAP